MSDAHSLLHPSRRARIAAFVVAMSLLAVSAVVWLSPSTAEPSATSTKSPEQLALEQENAELRAALEARTVEISTMTRSQKKAAAERAAGAARGKLKAQVERAEAVERGKQKAAAERAKAASLLAAKKKSTSKTATATAKPASAQPAPVAVPVKPTPPPSPPPAPVTIVTPSLAGFMAPTHRQFGMYTTQAPFNWAEYDNVAASIGVQPTIAGYFQGWDGPFRADAVERSWKKGALPLLTWESRPLKAANDQAVDSNYSLPKIIGDPANGVPGAYDDYLHQYARDVAALGLPLAIRLDHEMNGGWYPWGERRWGGDPLNGNRKGDYVKMWRHVHDIFEAEGANAFVIWVWAPNIVNALPTWAKSSPWYMRSLYPGDDYVDWVGLSGYYRPPYRADQKPTFDYTYGPSLKQLRSFTDKPIFLAEIGASEVGGKKPAWVADLFAGLARPENADVIGFAWFNHVVTTITGGQRVTNDWRINSRRDSQAAFVKGITNPAAGFVDGVPSPLAAASTPTPTPPPTTVPTTTPTPSPEATPTLTPTPDPEPSPTPEPTAATRETAPAATPEPTATFPAATEPTPTAAP